MLWGHFGKWGHSLKSMGQSSRGCLKVQIRSRFWFRARESSTSITVLTRTNGQTCACISLWCWPVPGVRGQVPLSLQWFPASCLDVLAHCFDKHTRFLSPQELLPAPPGPSPPRWAVNQRHDGTGFRNSQFYLCSVQQLSRKTKSRECKTTVTLIKVRNHLPEQAQELWQCNTGQIAIKVCD